MSWAGGGRQSQDWESDQGEVENIGLPDHSSKKSIRTEDRMFPHTAPLPLPGMEGGRKLPLKVSYCVLRAISIPGML